MEMASVSAAVIAAGLTVGVGALLTLHLLPTDTRAPCFSCW